MIKYKKRVKVFVSTKGLLLQDRINEELERLEKEGYYILSVDTDISYSGSAGYQVIGTIVYEEEYVDDSDDFKIPDTSGFVAFYPGESLPSSETTEA